MPEQNIRTIVATELDTETLEVRALAINIRILDPNPEKFDVEAAVRAACDEYVATEAGQAMYQYNCSAWNWADFESCVPNDICRHHGFEKLTGSVADISVDLNEQLVTEPADGEE